MRSSESTPRPSAEAGVPLFLWVAREDHPRACTGRRLLRQRLVRELRHGTRWPDGATLLDPTAPRPLTAQDAASARKNGVVGIDCSWNRLHYRGGFPRLDGLRPGQLQRRRLPWLVATNPQHFGRVGELSTVEALAAALLLLGEAQRAERLLGGFAGGAAFLKVNHLRLTRYARADNVEALLQIEAEEI